MDAAPDPRGPRSGLGEGKRRGNLGQEAEELGGDPKQPQLGPHPSTQSPI